MSASLAAQVASSADRHAAILHELSDLDYAPSALPGAENYARDLGALVREAEGKVKEARKKVAKERKDHLEIKDAGFKKFSYKLVGKGDDFKKKQTKEEQEFLLAQQDLQKEEHGLEGLKRNAKDAEENLVKIKSAVAKREQLQRQVDDLYARVFDGPTPEARRDDDLEATVKTTIVLNDEKQGALNYAGQTVAILGQARESIAEVVKNLQLARNHSTMDVWGGGVGSDIMEMNALHAADLAATGFKHAIMQARHFNPAVSNIEAPKIPKASAMDIMFDNVFTDLAQHDKIKAAQRDAARAVDTLKHEIAKMEERVNAAAVEAAMSANAVIQARKELHDFRARTFEEVLNASGGGPPTYSGSLVTSPSDDLPPAGFRGGVEEEHVGGFRPPNIGGQLFSPPPGPPPSGPFQPPAGPPPAGSNQAPGSPTNRQFAAPSGPPPSGEFAPPAGPPPTGKFSPPADPPPTTSSPFGFPAFSIDSSRSAPAGPSFPAFPTGPSAGSTTSTMLYAPSWPTFSTEPDSDRPPPPPPKWGSMNPYAAYLTRKGTADDIWWERHTPPPESTTPKHNTPAGVPLPASPAPDAGAAQTSSSAAPAAPANVLPAPAKSAA